MASWHSSLDPDSRVRLPEDLSSPQVLASGKDFLAPVDLWMAVSLPLNQSADCPYWSTRAPERARFSSRSDMYWILNQLDLHAKTAHDGFVKNVLGSGTKVVVEVDDPESSSTWMIARAGAWRDGS